MTALVLVAVGGYVVGRCRPLRAWRQHATRRIWTAEPHWGHAVNFAAAHPVRALRACFDRDVS